MTSALAPLPGDPQRLAAAAERLGCLASAVRGEASRFHDGARLATLAVLRSDAAPRIGLLHDGLRGVEAEYARLESSGVRAAALLAEHARRWQSAEDELDGLRAQVARAEDAATVTTAGADAGLAAERARGVRADAEDRARDLGRALLAQRAALVGEVRALIAGYSPAWAEVPAAVLARAVPDSPTYTLGVRLARGTATADDAWAAVRDAYGEVGDDDSRAWRSSTTYQVSGGLDETVGLLAGSVSDTGQAIAHPIDTLEGVARLGWALGSEPGRTVPLLVHGFVDPFRDDWEAGERGRAVGRGAATALGLLVGTKGLAKTSGAAREGGALERLAAGVADARLAREAHRLRSLGTRVGDSSTYAFASEQLAARALANPVPRSTYRVHHEGLPTDYVVDDRGDLVVVRGAGALTRADVPRAPAAAYEAWHFISRHRGAAAPGLKGNRAYSNVPTKKGAEARFPSVDARGGPIRYTEYDIVGKEKGRGRPPARLLHGSDGSLWFSDDHYVTGVRIR